VPGLEIAGRMTPCEAVGGDYLDFLAGDDFPGRGFGVAVGDVMGHGPAAALLMTAARASLRMRSARPGGVGEIVTDVNRRLAVDLGDVERFMTFYLLEIRDGEATWSGAGHEPALLLDPGAGSFTELNGDGPPLGVSPDVEFREHRAPFREPGQVLALWTDGITEAWSPGGEQFGRERFRRSLLTHAHLEAAGILDGVIGDVLAFRDGAPQADDLTLVILKRTP
jgi:sigma-B regulation protein RsbU (phosphoserine phosphatase)